MRPTPAAPTAAPPGRAARDEAEARLVVGPFNRVEGDLEVRLTTAGGRVRRAEVVASMYRGFENMLVGRDPRDALVIVPRICGICSVSQSVAAARALAALAGQAPPANGALAVNLMLACENLADHLTHFYVFFMPDFARPCYAERPWFAAVHERFAALSGRHARAALAARQRWFTMLGTLGGKWPHTHSVQPGGSSRALDASERTRLLARVREFRAFLEETLFAAPLEEVTALASLQALDAWHARDPQRGDLRLFLTLAAELELATLGRGPGRYLSHGAFVGPAGQPALAQGLFDAAGGTVRPVPLEQVREDATFAWLAGDAADARHPHQGQTVPQVDKPGAYTWNKAPRLQGQVVETGALARQLVHGNPLLRELVARRGSGVLARVLARLYELAQVTPWVEHWLAELRPGEPFHSPARLPTEGQAAGLAEAARGALGHWVTVRQGRIANYQIVSPTSWNFSPRDGAGTPGALEAALVGTPVAEGDSTPVAVQHVVRSFDPCMVCTVH
ncbi:MAG: nickel-dependent hydrogenase large subunit [Burkholderiales bacterium]|nr:nickel-dependent hydrogenase large subunit [Burkholderiales bacterium]